MDGQIARQSSSYRQGLVLGLTMAEILILLVFCLLIALAAFLRVEQQKRRIAEDRLATAQTQIASFQQASDDTKDAPTLKERMEELARTKDPAKIDEFWRELIYSKNLIAELKSTGLTEAEIKNTLSEGKKLIAGGLDAEKALAASANLESIKKVVPAAKEGVLADYIKSALDTAKTPPIQPGNKWPPIISLSDAEGYRFKSGSAELSFDFRQSLRDKVPGRIVALMKEFDVDLIEVVGHTDEQPLGVKQSNLDRDLMAALKNNGEVSKLIPADNAGLGLARAVAVAGVLLKDQALMSYKIMPLSGAQLIKNDESLATDGNASEDRERRRIEIRLRKSSPSDIAMKNEVPPPPTSTRAVPRTQKTGNVEIRPLGPPLFIRPASEPNGLSPVR